MARVGSLTAVKENFQDINTELLVLGIRFEGQLSSNTLSLDEKMDNSITNAVKIEKFDGKKKTDMLTYGNDKVQRVMVVGLGEIEKFQPDTARALGARVMKRANKMKVRELCVDSESLELNSRDILQAFAEGLILGGYEFTEYQSKQDDNHTVEEIRFIHCNDPATIDKANKLISGVFLARDVSNHPPNVATPGYLAAEAEKLSGFNNISVKVIDEQEFESLGLGAFYGVARGSARQAKLILINYNNAGDDKPFALVGKGLTFDSGGISLKPGANMDEMKFDMCGSATVLGVMKAVGELQPSINIIAAIGATENMPGGNAQLPGDIVRAYNGKTIEILNTDAEGRLVLADVLSYVTKNYQPAGILDFATLTGAVLIALGHKASGIMGNDPDLVREVKKSAEETGEKVWELPLWEEYGEDIKSKIADIKNIGDGRMSGTIAAGSFLKEFVGDTPWCHMDIAGTAWGVKNIDHQPKTGATGVAVRLVYRLLENRIK